MNEQFDSETSFLEAMGDVKPLSQDKINTHDPSRSVQTKQQHAEQISASTKQAVPLSLGEVIPVLPDDFLTYKQAGIQDGVYKNLRLGKYSLDLQLNLTGLTLEMSAIALYNTLNDSHAKGHRAILLRHGKGENSKPFPALKKSYVNQWLREIEPVIAFHTAQPVHGGLGATYVLLKKHAEQKLINREKNRRR